jgi:hypothetical protein
VPNEIVVSHGVSSLYSRFSLPTKSKTNNDLLNDLVLSPKINQEGTLSGETERGFLAARRRNSLLIPVSSMPTRGTLVLVLALVCRHAMMPAVLEFSFAEKKTPSKRFGALAQPGLLDPTGTECLNCALAGIGSCCIFSLCIHRLSKNHWQLMLYHSSQLESNTIPERKRALVAIVAHGHQGHLRL